jgi:EpsI family protein
VLFIFTALFIHLHKDTAIPANRPFSTFPVQIGEWRMSAESFMTGNVLKVLKPTDYLWRIYENRNGERVTIYLGYHSGSRNEGGVHSPKHCLPGSGWYEVYSKKSKMETSSGSINFVKSLYQKAEESELFLYWFQVIGRTLDNEYSLKLFEIINSSIHHRKDAAFVRISIPIKNSEAGAVRLGESFIRDFYPVISSYLPS